MLDAGAIVSGPLNKSETLHLLFLGAPFVICQKLQKQSPVRLLCFISRRKFGSLITLFARTICLSQFQLGLSRFALLVLLKEVVSMSIATAPAHETNKDG